MKYYVTMVCEAGSSVRKVAWLVGPFATFTAAQAYVTLARREASYIDSWSDFHTFGVTGVDWRDAPGVLNERVGYVLEA